MVANPFCGAGIRLATARSTETVGDTSRSRKFPNKKREKFAYIFNTLFVWMKILKLMLFKYYEIINKIIPSHFCYLVVLTYEAWRDIYLLFVIKLSSYLTISIRNQILWRADPGLWRDTTGTTPGWWSATIKSLKS